ncbi:cell division protein FtsQ/DivIB [Flavobacterium orientale]|uniref:Cell division protein FtsQ n=1 Tax=Flavobacterium orientale TaxID=1756020 RepID=A0A916XVE3_9FLAO|nr:cell division protein FtsQ [Flavobacterium orientale]GGD13728.1 cell division protein FtsQ [Flavobacterium orientale]
MKKHFNWTNLRLLLVLGLVVFLFAFSTKRNEQRKLTKSIVEFVGEDQLFVTHETVNKLLIENKKDASAIRKVALDLNSLEFAINQHDMVEKSQVYVSIDGILKAVVKQKTPIARVFNANESYYIDYEGTKMPLSDIHTARVPLISGMNSQDELPQLIGLLRHIYDSEFLKRNIIGIQISPTGQLMMKNRNFDYVIDFGKSLAFEDKFKNYEAFFYKAIQDSSIYQYKKIDLKYSQQVVCTK